MKLDDLRPPFRFFSTAWTENTIWQSSAKSTLFHDDQYIRKLNQLLNSEQLCVNIYAHMAVHMEPIRTHLADQHQRAGRMLRTIIIANRGLPEDHSAISDEAPRWILHAIEALPKRLSAFAAHHACRRLEQQLMDHYEEILEMAPASDAHDLKTLRGLAEDNYNLLNQHITASADESDK